MSDATEKLDEIKEVNLSYLLLAQRLLREDKATGMFRLGISAELAGILGALTFTQTVKLAATGQMLCRFRFDDHAVLSALTHQGKNAGVAQSHAAILLAGQPAEQIG